MTQKQKAKAMTVKEKEDKKNKATNIYKRKQNKR